MAAEEEKDLEEMRGEGWQGHLMTERWEDEEIGDECFSWISEWKRAPTNTISGNAKVVPADAADENILSREDRSAKRLGCDVSPV